MEADYSARIGSDVPVVHDGDDLTERIIGCAIEVHRHLGPGLLESAYEGAMCVELSTAGLRYECQPMDPSSWSSRALSVSIQLFEAQVLTYLRVTGKKVGLLINFNSRLLKDGIKRFVL
jgi:hypothetical protein